MKESSRRNQIMETQTTLKSPSPASVHFVDGSIERCMQSSSSFKSSPISVSHTSHMLLEIRLNFQLHSIFPTTEQYATKEDLTFPILYDLTFFCNNQYTRGSFFDISFFFSSLIFIYSPMEPCSPCCSYHGGLFLAMQSGFFSSNIVGG